MKRTRVISTVLILSIVLIMGFLATWLTWSLTTRKLTREILNQAGLVAQSINISRLMTLQGNEQDLESANYLRIKEQLTQIRKNLSRCRFLYLMGKREDGTIFFYMDAQSVDSEDYAPPGLIYEEVPEEYLQTFNTGKSQVVGPITDRWGTLISGLVPIYAADNNRLLAVLGMDIEADDWHRYILFQCSLPVGLTIFVLLLISLFLFVNPQREKDEKQVRTIVLFMLAVLFPGMFLTWYTWGYTNNQMRESALEQARLVARSISVKRIQNLKGDQTDLNSQDYQRIKEQLFLIRKSHSTCRFLYLMGQKEDGTVFFFLDSQPTTSSDYAPPGLVYKEVSAEYLEHFKNAKDGTVGPITDRWGTLVTSLVPIFSNEDNQLIAILGMDIDTRDWKEKAILQCLLPIGLTLFIMFLTFSLLILNENRKTIRKQNLEIKEKHAESKRLLHILCHDLANPIGNMDLILEALKSDPTQLEELLDLATIANNNALEIIELVRNIREIDEKESDVSPVSSSQSLTT